MIELGTIDGQPALLNYVDANLVPVDDKADAAMIAAWLEDGRHLFLIVPGVSDEGTKIAQGDGQGRFDDIDDAGAWREELHPRGQPKNKGQFGPGGGGSGTDKKTQRQVSSAAGLVKRARAAGRSIASQHEYETSKGRPSAAQQRARVKGEEASRAAAAGFHQQAAALRAEREAAEAAEAKRVAKGGKKKPKITDFVKANITVSADNDERFLQQWEAQVGMDPEEFKKEFLGGVKAQMEISMYTPTRMNISGSLQSDDNKYVGRFERDVDFEDKKAYSAYFSIEPQYQDSDYGKKVLAGNIATYEKVGITEVGVTANIDVGGYAWAKYGYVPTQASWDSLRLRLEAKITGTTTSSTRGSTTIEADDWEMLSDVQQAAVRDRWMDESHEEFKNNEIDSWRENGGALEDAKARLAHDYERHGFTPNWMTDSLDELREKRRAEGDPEIPYTNQQIYKALKVEYDGDGEGGPDPEFAFDDEKLKKPDPKISGYDPDQKTLPGIEPLDPSSFMTDEMREAINSRLIYAFNSEADTKAETIEPPDFGEQITDYQNDVWDSKSDRDKLREAERYDMQHIEIETDEEEEELELEEKPKEEPKKEGSRSIHDMLKDSNPKTIWEVSDTAIGKEALLALSKAGYNWSGKLNLKDPASYKRFKEYVGRVKKEKKRAA